MNTTVFELRRQHRIASLNVELSEYRHRATGARHFHIAAEDDNNSFLVGFPTVPMDSTGVAHILEHTTLCGSERFPVRDPFFMMLRRSLNTFMNAFTSSDTTAYPFATRNRKDFDNLLQVYIDAVFFPRLDPLDFAQEGHRLEFSEPGNPDSELVFKGVVYNEMKGAMSAPTAQLWQALQSRLFPTTTYHYNSGGEPSEIPDLSYEGLKDFHRSHYHPSNAVFITYGDIDASAHQARFQELALARFSAREFDLAIPDEQRYPAPRQDRISYAIEPDEDPRDKTHIVIGWLLGHSFRLGDMLHSALLAGVLLDNSSSPLRHALETTGLGSAPSELTGLDDSLREAVFVCGLEGSNPEAAEAVEQLVLGVLERVAAEGVDPAMLEAVLHQLEMEQREVRSGSEPYGLQLTGRILSPIQHGGDPFKVLELDRALAELREECRDPDLIPRLARGLLENPHRVRLVMSPDPDKEQRDREAEHQRLAAIRASLGEADKRAIVEASLALQQRQQQADDPGCLPRLGLEDVPAGLKEIDSTRHALAAGEASLYQRGTNGLQYQQLVVDVPDLEAEDIDLLALYWDCITELGCGDEDYLQVQMRQARIGSVSAYGYWRARPDDAGSVRTQFVLSGKGLERDMEPLAGILRQHLLQPRFDERQRLRELISQFRASAEMSVTAHGHSLALAAASANMGPAGQLSQRWDGLLGLQRLKALDDALDDKGALGSFADRLAAIQARLADAPRQFLLVGDAGNSTALLENVRRCWEDVAPGQAGDALAVACPGGPVRQAWVCPSQVNFCARTYPTVALAHADSAVLMVLGQVLTNGYLHGAIREQGGAYGGGAGYDGETTAFRFFSYRDPRLLETLADFDRALDWLAAGKADPRQLVEAILGVIRGLDAPESPAGEAIRDFYQRQHGRGPEFRRRLRQAVLAVSLEDLQRVAETYLQPARANTAVVCSASALEAAGDHGLEVVRV